MVVSKNNLVGTDADEIKKDLMGAGANSKTYGNLFTKGASIRFGATDPFPLIPEVSKGQHIDVRPQLQKACGGRSWEVNDDLFVMEHQIERQLGHTLDERGKRKQKKKIFLELYKGVILIRS